ncbi:metallopeptidase TldD-related protein, partial [Bullifex sp.]|uniref:metallopeptidase TldD-related protein n=1 Tax=Bullifex sp. TaxID=2815808 RepID=UPI002A83A85D
KSIRYYASSNALELFDSNDDAYVMANCKVSDGVDIQNAYSIKEGLIDDVNLTDGVDKAISQLSPKKINSGTYNVVFNQDCMQQILDTFFSVFTGKSSYYGLTRYKDREGEKVASEKVTIIDDPLYPEYRVRSTFDGDGYPCEKKRVIENGVLNTLLYNLEYGTKCNKKSTGNGFRSAINGSAGITSYSFYIKPGENTLEDLFKSSEGGIYITQMKGFHAGANSISGDFSIESAGFIIKDGKAEEAINEFTVSGNFYSLLENVLLVANDLEFDVTLSSQRMGSPSVLVKDLSISGK